MPIGGFVIGWRSWRAEWGLLEEERWILVVLIVHGCVAGQCQIIEAVIGQTQIESAEFSVSFTEFVVGIAVVQVGVELRAISYWRGDFQPIDRREALRYECINVRRPFETTAGRQVEIKPCVSSVSDQIILSKRTHGPRVFHDDVAEVSFNDWLNFHRGPVDNLTLA